MWVCLAQPVIDFVLGPLTPFQDGGRYLYVSTDVFASYTSEGFKLHRYKNQHKNRSSVDQLFE